MLLIYCGPPGEDEESDEGDDTERKAGKMRSMAIKFNTIASPPYKPLHNPLHVLTSPRSVPSYDFHPT